jgi:hypothetical protein
MSGISSGGASLPQALKLTYTGTPKNIIVCSFQLGNGAIPLLVVNGQAIYSAFVGPTIYEFAYTEGNVATGNVLLTLSFDDLVGVTQSFAPTSMASLTSLDFPALVSVGVNFNPTQMGALLTLTLPELVYIGSSFNPTTMASLGSISLPKLKNVGGGFSPQTMASVTSIIANVLETIGNNINIASMASLTTVSFAGLVYLGSTISMNSGLGNLTTVTLGTPGTLKELHGATINISGQKLNQASVNAILALLVSLDGTNGTILWGAGKTVNISGGTSAAPSGQGATDKTTLVARGATVTTN